MKKCIICGEEAKFAISNCSDFYCEECAKENFSDLGMLNTLADQAKALKQAIKEKMQD